MVEVPIAHLLTSTHDRSSRKIPSPKKQMRKRRGHFGSSRRIFLSGFPAVRVFFRFSHSWFWFSRQFFLVDPREWSGSECEREKKRERMEAKPDWPRMGLEHVLVTGSISYMQHHNAALPCPVARLGSPQVAHHRPDNFFVHFFLSPSFSVIQHHLW